MKFGAAPWLVALPIVVAALVALWIWSSRRAHSTLRTVFQTPLLTRLLSSVDPKRRWLKRGLVACGLAGIVIALARPQWGRSEIELERTGVDVMIALDVSRSMLAVDAAQTNRLAVAVSAIERLVRNMGGDRLGLVLFAGEAYMVAPLTRDHVAVERALSFAGPTMISEQGSDLGRAIKRARESFDAAGRGPRALLVVSDGEQLQGDAIEAARQAFRDGITIHTAGVGSAMGARVPSATGRNPGFVRNALGREVISRRDEQRLQRICQAGGGIYTRVSDLESPALVDWFKTVSARLTRHSEKQTLNEPAERFQWPLAFALVVLAAEWMLSERKRRRSDEIAATP
jgi:Ca-activated chloride channel family protein